jgi:uncharacterized protein YhaN
VTGGDALQASTAVPFDGKASFQLSALRSSSALKISNRSATALTGLRDHQNNLCEESSTRYRLALGKVEAVGGDDAVARIEEEKRTVLLDIEERANRYLRLRIGTAAAEQALHIYRDRHRGSMMARASNAFHTISRGAYAKLATQAEKDAEVLVAVGAGGSSKVASQLGSQPSDTNHRFAPIVLKNSKIAGLRKSRKCRALAISAAARLCRIDTSVSDRFASIDVVPHLAARKTHQRS